MRVGIGTRVLNCFVDTLLVFLLAYAAFNGWNWYVRYWNYTYYNFGWFFWTTMFVYYMFFESIFKRTPGKWLSYSKVAGKTGTSVSVAQVFVRSLVRLTIIDMFFLPFLDKTLHDHLSRTEVVEV